MTTSPFWRLACAALVCCLASVPASAQRTTIGLEGHAASLLGSDALGSGDLYGVGGRLSVATTPWFLWGVDVTRAPGKTPIGGREYTAWRGSVDLEPRLIGDANRIFASISPSVLVIDQARIPGAVSRRFKVLGLGAGAGLSFHVLGPFSASLVGEDFITWTRSGTIEGTAIPTDPRRLGHSLSLRAGLTLNIRRKERVARFEDLPVSFTEDFRPVRASETMKDSLAATNGKTHSHLGPEAEEDLVPPGGDRRLTDDVLLGTVYFANGSDLIDGAGEKIVRDIATYLRGNPAASVRIRGYTSPAGALHANLSLAERRATAIKATLVNYFQIEEGRIEVLASGIDPDSPDGEARRAEVRVVTVRSGN